MLAVNHTYNNSPRDGSVIIYAQDSNVVEQYLNEENAKYDVRKLNWLGSMVEFEYTLGLDKDTGVTTVDDLKKKEYFIGSTGVGSASHVFPTLTNAVLGTKMKVVGGYTGGAPAIYLALERKEMQGYVTQYWHSKPVFKGLNPILTFGAERSNVFPEVKTLLEHVKDPQDRKVVQFAGLIGTLGRGFATMPDVPADRVAALRKAFDQMAVDPEFIRELKATGTGEEVRKAALTGTEFNKRLTAGMDIGSDVINRMKTMLAEK
jgi:tripartite-type tricarboxylate transporter receptor subunit TctC